MAETKQCIECGDVFPKTRDYFKSNGYSNGRLTFKARCKTCYNGTRPDRNVVRQLAPRKIDNKIEPDPNQLIEVMPIKRRYVVTYAQNATPVHEAFWRTLQVYADHNDAQIVVIPGRYHNPTSVWSKHMRHQDYWDHNLDGYLFNGRHRIGENLFVYGDISIQPTATTPLSDLQIFAGPASAVFGHPKIQLETVPTATRLARTLVTTAGVTIPNYVASKAGKKAEEHHVFGAALIEYDDLNGLCHIRQLNADDADGSFIDLNKLYTVDGVYGADPALGLVLGDSHIEKTDQRLLDAAIFAQDSMVNVLRPRELIHHDILDFDVRNHHHRNDPMDRYARVVGVGCDSVEEELNRVLAYLQSLPADTSPVVIASNHDEAFDRWLREIDPKSDPINARLFHKMWHALLEEFDRTNEWTPALELYARKHGDTRTKFIRRNMSHMVGDIECALHGDKGINGSRAGKGAYAKLGVKTVSGHGHSGFIRDGNYGTGHMSQPDHGYNFIPSSWSVTNCVIYANSKRSLMNIIFDSNGKAHWRLEDEPMQKVKRKKR